jgi:mannose-6-phosphate isomerase
MYPLKFHPILKEKVWGGDKLHKMLGKDSGDNVGESWELSGVAGSVSEVANGPLKGQSLKLLLETYGPQILGERVFGTFGSDFPLLFKYIDAKEDLSVQLHPDDKLALKRHSSFGKTEMWYIIDNDPGARLILGFKEEIDKATYQQILSEGNITKVLHSEQINPGGAFFIAPGTVHAIGGGTLLAEIQQTSDVTYRIYDWDRQDTNGKLRELHTDMAVEAIDFKPSHAHLTYKDINDERIRLCRSPYFETNKIILTKPLQLEDSRLDSFRVYMCLAGEVIIETVSGSVGIEKGETLLVPACLHKVLLNTNSATLLEVYIP